MFSKQDTENFETLFTRQSVVNFEQNQIFLCPDCFKFYFAMKRILPPPSFWANHVLATESNPLDYFEDLQLKESCRVSVLSQILGL